MRKILCVTYRQWASEIYQELEKTFPEKDWLIVNSRKEYSYDLIETFQPDLILWYGWSWIIPENVVKNYTCLCLHPSPLPKYRGGSPIQNQIIRGETTSAVSIFQMSEGIDDGIILKQVPISLIGNVEDIFKRMTNVGIVATSEILNGKYKPMVQNHDEATFFNRRKPKQSEITLDEIKNKPANYLYNKIRMLTGPYPSAYIRTVDNKKLYISGAYLEEK